MSVKSVTKENFKSIVSEPGVKLIRFWASWCAPCMMMAPIYKNAANKLSDKALLGEVDVIAQQDLANLHRIRSIPTTVLYKDGKHMGQFSGVLNESELLSIVNQALN